MTHSERTPILGVDPWNDELIIGDEYNIVGIQTSNYEVVKYDQKMFNCHTLYLDDSVIWWHCFNMFN